MTRVFGGYTTVFVVMVALDFVWLALIAKPMYQLAIGHLMADRPNLGVALLFYLVFALGLTMFAVWPQVGTAGWRITLVKGALFGFFAYATYDLTNLATLKDWPVRIALMDLAWGTVVSGISAASGKLLIDRLSP